MERIKLQCTEDRDDFIEVEDSDGELAFRSMSCNRDTHIYLNRESVTKLRDSLTEWLGEEEADEPDTTFYAVEGVSRKGAYLKIPIGQSRYAYYQFALHPEGGEEGLAGLVTLLKSSERGCRYYDGADFRISDDGVVFGYDNAIYPREALIARIEELFPELVKAQQPKKPVLNDPAEVELDAEEWLRFADEMTMFKSEGDFKILSLSLLNREPAKTKYQTLTFDGGNVLIHEHYTDHHYNINALIARLKELGVMKEEQPTLTDDEDSEHHARMALWYKVLELTRSVDEADKVVKRGFDVPAAEETADPLAPKSFDPAHLTFTPNCDFGGLGVRIKAADRNLTFEMFSNADNLVAAVKAKDTQSGSCTLQHSDPEVTISSPGFPSFTANREELIAFLEAKIAEYAKS